MTLEHIWQGRVERKMKRKLQIELSLKVEGVDRTQTLLLLHDESAHVQHPTCLQLQALVQAIVIKHDKKDGEKNGDETDRTWIVKRLELLECPAEPTAIKAVLQVPELWHTLEPYDPTGSSEGSERVHYPCMNEEYMVADHSTIRGIVLRLQRRETSAPRKRHPHIKFKELKALEAMEQHVQLVHIHIWDEEVIPQPSNMASMGWNLPQTDDDRILVSTRHKHTRQEYLESKKHPQIAWFLQRLQLFPGQPLRHVLDVGGGRGDLAIALAIGLGPETQVTVVDMKESSLDAGRRFAEQCGVASQMEWICSDFSSYISREPSFGSGMEQPFDVVVALHACGNLSDMAMDFAVNQNASFLICPCCYSKMANQTIASRLAEVSERPDLSRRGMHVVNSTRYWQVLARNSYDVLLEEYSRGWSSRNMVLVGWPKE